MRTLDAGTSLEPPSRGAGLPGDGGPPAGTPPSAVPRRWSAAGALALGLSAGCFSGADAKGLPCERDEDCGVGQACALGVCGGRTTDPVCGDWIIDEDEECDQGPLNDEHGACTPDCKIPGCGDGWLQPELGEACDDGNVTPGDGCDATCKLETCGDGVEDEGEECDLGADNDDQGACTTLCTLPVCGDGFVQVGEACDAAGRASAECDPDCTLPSCGDGTHNEAAGEECDPGGDPESAACMDNCTVPLLWEDVESGVPDWEVESLLLGPQTTITWAPSTNAAASGTRSFRGGGQPGDGVSECIIGCEGDVRLVSPTLNLAEASPPIRLRFAHRYAFDPGMSGNDTGDGGVVEVRVGSDTTILVPIASYPETIEATGCGVTNPLEGEAAYSGTTNGAFLTDVFDLDAFAGETIAVAFRVGYDCGNATSTEGWFVDDIVVWHSAE